LRFEAASFCTVLSSITSLLRLFEWAGQLLSLPTWVLMRSSIFTALQNLAVQQLAQRRFEAA
jgi:hypothetical protein